MTASDKDRSSTDGFLPDFIGFDEHMRACGLCSDPHEPLCDEGRRLLKIARRVTPETTK